MKFVITFLLAFTFQGFSQAQLNHVSEGPHEVIVSFTNEEMVMDGVLDEATWKISTPAKDFSQYFPSDTTSALGQTEVYFSYDDNYLYVAAKCYTKGEDFVIKSMKRDYGFSDNDNISFIFDTFGDNTNAFLFGVNAIGARREALIANGGRKGSDFDSSWDHKWDGNAKMYEDHWIGEIAIPFNAIRFNVENDYWRFNVYRQDLQHNEISTWLNIPRNYILMNMNYMGKLIFDQSLKKQKRNLSAIPYASVSANRDFEDELQEGTDMNYGIGVDFKYGITSGLNLDVTINPDFSQVEVDRQVTNLDRFEIFFPERRQFFLENADLFGGFGSTRLNPFFSRRIGIALDTATDLNVQNQVLYGARLSGKVNDQLRVGILNMQTASDISNDLPGFNYSILTAEQKLTQKTSLAVIGLNKQAINFSDFSDSNDPYNRLAGLEYRFASQNEKFSGKVSYMHSFSASEKSDNYAHLFQLIYNVRKLNVEWNHQIIGNGFDAQMGFVPRRDILSINPIIDYRVFPEGKKLSRWSIGLQFDNTFKLGRNLDDIIQEFKLLDRSNVLFWSGSFQNNSRFNANVSYNNVFLLDDFDPSRVQEDDIFLPAGTEYDFWGVGFSFRSDRSKRITFNTEQGFGEFFNGYLYRGQYEVAYRFQPFGTLGVRVNYNNIRLAEPFEQVNLWLIGPNLDFSFSKTIFLTSFIQYNNQLDNFNVNCRLQWRYSQASDIFLVYTDNYLTETGQFQPRNRGFVLKWTYWLNI